MNWTTEDEFVLHLQGDLLAQCNANKPRARKARSGAWHKVDGIGRRVFQLDSIGKSAAEIEDRLKQEFGVFDILTWIGIGLQVWRLIKWAIAWIKQPNMADHSI